MRLGGRIDFYYNDLHLPLTIENFANGLGVSRRTISAQQPKAIRNFNGSLTASGANLFIPKISYAFNLTLGKSQGAILEAMYNEQQIGYKSGGDYPIVLVDNRQTIVEEQGNTRFATPENESYFTVLNTVDYFARFKVMLVFGDDYKKPFGDKTDSYVFSAVETERF